MKLYRQALAIRMGWLIILSLPGYAQEGFVDSLAQETLGTLLQKAHAVGSPRIGPPRSAPLTVEAEGHHDRRIIQAILDVLDKLLVEYPRLSQPDILAKVVFKDDESADNIHYDESQKAIVILNPGPSLIQGRLASGAGRIGAQPEITLFHELLHGVDAAMPGLAKAYQERISGDRRKVFRAQMLGAENEIVGERNRKRGDAVLLVNSRQACENALRNHPDQAARAPARASCEKAYDQAAARMSLEEARRFMEGLERENLRMVGKHAELLGLSTEAKTPEEINKEIERAEKSLAPGSRDALRLQLEQWREENTEDGRISRRAREGLRDLLKRHRIPRRIEDDSHAAENDGEWFAYGGEFFVYATRPEDYLTTTETAFWRAMIPCLRGAGPLPSIE